MATTSTLARTAAPRTLDRLPSTGQRWRQYAATTFVSTVVFYQLYVQGAVSPLLIADFGMSLRTFVLVSVVGNAVGAVAAWSAGWGDRVGRVRLVVAGSAAASVLVGLALPAAGSATTYLLLYALLSVAGGVVLVSTAALVRDFSPQVGRATAMGLWAVGPSLGNLLISASTSALLPRFPAWEFHFRLAGTLGIAAIAVAVLVLRELAPEVRHQVVVRPDQVARPAAPPASTGASGMGSMWRAALVLPAVGISLFLVFYVTRIGFLVLYLVANFGYTPAEANGLATWFWVTNIAGFVLVGIASDRLGVRKPFLLAGWAVSLGGLALFAGLATEAGTGYTTLLVLLVVLALAGSTVSTSWLALYSEAVERIDPAAVARGMAVYGATLRAFAVVTLLGFMSVVTAAGTLVDDGPRVSALSQRYERELATLAVLARSTAEDVVSGDRDGAVLFLAVEQAEAAGLARPEAAVRRLFAVPPEDLAYLADAGPRVQAAAAQGPQQWQTWWWVCLVAQALLLPLVWRVPGPWRRRAQASGT